jgi:hypothetical protein
MCSFMGVDRNTRRNMWSFIGKKRNWQPVKQAVKKACNVTNLPTWPAFVCSRSLVDASTVAGLTTNSFVGMQTMTEQSRFHDTPLKHSAVAEHSAVSVVTHPKHSATYLNYLFVMTHLQYPASSQNILPVLNTSRTLHICKTICSR